jgi:hypothetical protein
MSEIQFRAASELSSQGRSVETGEYLNLRKGKWQDTEDYITESYVISTLQLIVGLN